MTKRSVKEDDSLDDFSYREIAFDDIAKRVYVSGSGPAVIVMTEMPGISPHVARFSRWVRDAGFTVYMPSLFGRDGVLVSADEGAAIFKRACISAEFRAFAANESSPVTQWLRALARLAHEACTARIRPLQIGLGGHRVGDGHKMRQPHGGRRNANARKMPLGQPLSLVDVPEMAQKGAQIQLRVDILRQPLL